MVLPRAFRAACCLVLGVTLLLSVSCAFPGSVGPTIKIGLVAPFEGRYRYVGYDVIYAVRLALQEVNDGGGVAGYGVELVAFDDGADPAMASEQARKLDVDPDVLGALGHFREGTTLAALDVYAEAGLPLLVPAGLDCGVGESEIGHALGPPPEGLALPLLDRAIRMTGDHSIVLISDGGCLGEALRQGARRRGLELITVSIPGEVGVRPILMHNPGVLLCDLAPVSAGEVVSALRDQAWAGAVLGGPALATADFAAVAGAAAVGATFATPWPFPRDVAGGDTFTAAYRDVSNGAMPGPLAIPTYEGTWVLVEALQQAAVDGAPTRERVSTALSELEEVASPGPGGRFGPIRSSDGGATSDLELVWYRIGPDGVPRIVDSEIAAGGSDSSQRLGPASANCPP